MLAFRTVTYCTENEETPYRPHSAVPIRVAWCSTRRSRLPCLKTGCLFSSHHGHALARTRTLSTIERTCPARACWCSWPHSRPIDPAVGGINGAGALKPLRLKFLSSGKGNETPAWGQLPPGPKGPRGGISTGCCAKHRRHPKTRQKDRLEDLRRETPQTRMKPSPYLTDCELVRSDGCTSSLKKHLFFELMSIYTARHRLNIRGKNERCSL